MVPTMREGQLLLVKYERKNFENGEIVVAKNSDGKTVIKRIIGCPYDKVSMQNGYIYINEIKKIKITKVGDISYPFTLKKDEYFLMGDNEKVSIDCRYKSFGLINRYKILGVPLFY